MEVSHDREHVLHTKTKQRSESRRLQYSVGLLPEKGRLGGRNIATQVCAWRAPRHLVLEPLSMSTSASPHIRMAHPKTPLIVTLACEGLGGKREASMTISHSPT